MNEPYTDRLEPDFHAITSVNEAWGKSFAEYVASGGQYSHQHIFYQGVEAGYEARDAKRDAPELK